MKKLRELAAKDAAILTEKQMKDVKGGVEKFQQFLDGGLVVEGGNGGSGCQGTKVTACENKESGQGCCFTWQGKRYDGRCLAFAPTYVLHCSDLN